MSAPQPLTGDELAAIKARAQAAAWSPRWIMEHDLPNAIPVVRDLIIEMSPETTLRLVAEVERLRAIVDGYRTETATRWTTVMQRWSE